MASLANCTSAWNERSASVPNFSDEKEVCKFDERENPEVGKLLLILESGFESVLGSFPEITPLVLEFPMLIGTT